METFKAGIRTLPEITLLLIKHVSVQAIQYRRTFIMLLKYSRPIKL